MLHLVVDTLAQGRYAAALLAVIAQATEKDFLKCRSSAAVYWVADSIGNALQIQSHSPQKEFSAQQRAVYVKQ